MNSTFYRMNCDFSILTTCNIYSMYVFVLRKHLSHQTYLSSRHKDTDMQGGQKNNNKKFLKLFRKELSFGHKLKFLNPFVFETL